MITYVEISVVSNPLDEDLPLSMANGCHVYKPLKVITHIIMPQTLSSNDQVSHGSLRRETNPQANKIEYI